MFKKYHTITHSCPSRDLTTIKRYVADGFTIEFKGATAVLRKKVAA